MEIGTHARAQVDGLADVDDLAVGIFHQIAAGFGGQCVENALQVFGDFHAGNFNIWFIYRFQVIFHFPGNSRFGFLNTPILILDVSILLCYKEAHSFIITKGE